MVRQILLPASVKTELKATFKTGHKALERALKFKINSGPARMLRAAALQRGGLIYDGPIPPEYIARCETTVDSQTRVVIQEFGTAARITLGGSRATVEIAGCDPVVIEGITTGNLRQLQYGIQQILNG